jgi:heme/copper-type cytochrome/quinol oxidase subunit 3
MAQPSRTETPPRMNATQARQGRLGRDVFWVLLVSTVLAFGALIAAWTWNSDRLDATEPNNARQARDAVTFEAPAPPAPDQVR